MRDSRLCSAGTDEWVGNFAVDLLASGVTDTGLGAGIGANVNVTVPVLTLIGASDEPGELEGYGPIDAETARKLAGTATSFLRILTHPHTGIFLDVSATPFRVPADSKGTLNWTSPAGKHYATDPAIRISPHLQQIATPPPAAAESSAVPGNDPWNDRWSDPWAFVLDIDDPHPQPL